MASFKYVRSLSKYLQVEWSDGLQAKFPYAWLRDSADREAMTQIETSPKPETVKFSKDLLSLRWPRFVNSQFSSEFLRSYATVRPLLSCPEPFAKSPISPAWNVQHATSKLPFPMESTEWGARYVEIGTVVPHFARLPPVCTIESTSQSRKARVYVTDSIAALQELRSKSPEEFNFLTNCSLRYQEGPFTANHRVVTLTNEEVTSVVFNNVSRSVDLPTNDVDLFYSSLQILGRILWTNTTQINLRPGERLVADNYRTMVGAPAQCGRHLIVKMF